MAGVSALVCQSAPKFDPQGVKIARRMTIDQLGNLGDLVVREDGIFFLTPFTVEYVEFLNQGKIENSREVLLAAGLPAAAQRYELRGSLVLGLVLETLKRQISGPLADKEHEKVEGLYDRIAVQLGVPPARSYPRVLPGDVVEYP